MRPSRAAFTLIELLVVIAIIAILAGLLLPALSRSKVSSNSAKCKNNARELVMALHIYEGDTEGFPFAAHYPVNTARGVNFWFDLVAPYAGNARWGTGVMECPGYKWAVSEGIARDGGIELAIGPFAYNGFGGPLDLSGAAAANGRGLGNVAFDPSIKPHVIKATEVKAPAEMFALGDSIVHTWPGAASKPGGDCFYMGGSFVRTHLLGVVQHKSSINMACVDGHVESLRSSNALALPIIRRWNRDNLD